MFINGRVDLLGTGRLVMAAGNENIVLPGTADALLAVGAQQTLTTAANSAGVVRASLLNLGHVEARGANATLDLKLTALANRNTLAAADGADLRIGPANASTVIDNHGGRIEAGASSRVFLADAGHPANIGITTVQGGVLAGTGTFFMQRAQLSQGVHIAPGHSPGLLSFNGNLAMDPLGGLEIELGGLVPGSGHDRVNVAGSTTLAGTLDLSLWGGFLPHADDVFTILSASSVGGAFSNVQGGRVAFASGSFDVLVSATDVKLLHFEAAPVPEPGTWALMLGGLLSLARRAARKATPR